LGGDEGLIELGIIVKNIRSHVPNSHISQSSTRFFYSMALLRLDRKDEALSVLREATTFYRQDPYHRKDTLAFMVAKQAWLIGRIGNTSLANTIAKEAFDMVDLAEARGDLAVEIAGVYADSLLSNNETQKAQLIMRQLINNDKFIDKLSPIDKIQLYLSFGATLMAAEKYPDAAAVFDKAAAAVPYPGYKSGYPQVAIMVRQSANAYRDDKLALAFETIHQANLLTQKIKSEMVTGSGGNVPVTNDDYWQVQNEVVMGWELAQTLPK